MELDSADLGEWEESEIHGGETLEHVGPSLFSSGVFRWGKTRVFTSPFFSSVGKKKTENLELFYHFFLSIKERKRFRMDRSGPDSV